MSATSWLGPPSRTRSENCNERSTGRPRPIPDDGSTRSTTRSTAETFWSARGSWCAPTEARPASTDRPSPTSRSTASTRLLDELAADLKEGRLASASGPPGVHPEARQTAGAQAALDPCCPRSRRAGGHEDGDRADLRGRHARVLVRVPSRGARRTTRSRFSSMRRGGAGDGLPSRTSPTVWSHRHTACAFMGVVSNRLVSACGTSIRRPFRRPLRTWRACSSPRLTRCNTVWRETPRIRIASTIGT